MNKRLKIQEIESFDWPSVKGRIARHTFKPKKRMDRETMLVIAGLAIALVVAFLHYGALPSLVSEARAGTDNAEYCKEWLQGEYANDYQPEIALICAKEL